MHVLGLYYCPQTGVYDIGLVIRIDVLEQKMGVSGTPEYPLLHWYTFDEFEQKLASPNVKIVPLSKALWNTYRGSIV